MSDQLMDKWTAAGTRIMTECGPRILHLRNKIDKHAYLRPSAVMLPERYDPGKYDGDDATDHPAQLFGLPVIWGPTIALIYEARRTEEAPPSFEARGLSAFYSCLSIGTSAAEPLRAFGLTISSSPCSGNLSTHQKPCSVSGS